VFTVAERERARERVLEVARGDRRVVAGAEVGGLVGDRADRWSDVDLTFAVADGVALTDVLDDWTAQLARDLGAAHLFDLPAGPSLYRVLLLPGALQVDVSVTPAAAFGARGPRFRLLFGEAVDVPQTPPPDARELFGLAAHHAVRARTCVERERFWEAEYWISALRDHALELACLRHDLPARYGRGFDDLPAGVREPFEPALVRALERGELLRALAEAIDGLLRESAQAPDLAAQVEADLRALVD